MNKLAMAAFIGSMIAIIGTPFIASFFLLSGICFILGIVALVQILHRKERGIGFAIGAILGLVGALVFVVALANVLS